MVSGKSLTAVVVSLNALLADLDALLDGTRPVDAEHRLALEEARDTIRSLTHSMRKRLGSQPS